MRNLCQQRHTCQRLLILALLVVSACSRPPAMQRRSPQTDPPVRIGLQVRVADATVQFYGDFELLAPGQPATLLQPGSLRLAVLRGDVVAWTNDGREYRASSQLQLQPLTDAAYFTLGEHSYRGRLDIVRQQGALTLINVLPLEAYLRGVVPWEIGWRDAEAASAVEAQAIAARTYACNRFGQYEEKGFDLLPGVMDQVYRGMTREDSVANRAITATHGIVMMAQGNLIEAYYSSTCGGHTSRIEEVWDKPAEIYLVGGYDRAASGGGAFCSQSKHFRWSEAWSGVEIEQVLQQTLPRELEWPADSTMGSLVDLRILGRDSSGRVQRLEIATTKGTWSVAGDRIRWVLSPKGRTILRSILFQMDVEKEAGVIVRVVVQGGGNGHCVGMCQIGAIEMARRGYSHDAILSHYYPQTTLAPLY